MEINIFAKEDKLMGIEPSLRFTFRRILPCKAELVRLLVSRGNWMNATLLPTTTKIMGERFRSDEY